MHLSVLRLTLAACLMWVAAALPARAVTLLRDSEIEYALAELARPILNAAGLPASQTKILVIEDSSLNAFVVDGQVIFLNSGLLLKLESAAQVQAVIAHEAAHIANGHLARRVQNVRNARTASGLGMALAGIAAASGSPEVAGGLAMGVGSSSRRVLFGHTRTEESSADQSSLRYMIRAGVDPAAAREVLEIFRGQEALSVGRQDPYVRTHPLSRDRIRAVGGLVAANPGNPGDSTSADYWFARAQGKLSAFIQNPSWTLRRTRGQTDQISLMRQAVAYHRTPRPTEAARAINSLVSQRPNDPFVHELKGQILLENRQAAAAAQAYARAVQLAPHDALILGGYGRALLAMDTRDSNARALQVLEQARARDWRAPNLLRDLGLAYARAGRPGEASLVTAERYALRGRLNDALVHARRAEGLLPRGSAAWQRAQDVIFAAEQHANRR